MSEIIKNGTVNYDMDYINERRKASILMSIADILLAIQALCLLIWVLCGLIHVFIVDSDIPTYQLICMIIALLGVSIVIPLCIVFLYGKILSCIVSKHDINNRNIIKVKLKSNEYSAKYIDSMSSFKKKNDSYDVCVTIRMRKDNDKPIPKHFLFNTVVLAGAIRKNKIVYYHHETIIVTYLKDSKFIIDVSSLNLDD